MGQYQQLYSIEYWRRRARAQMRAARSDAVAALAPDNLAIALVQAP
jgi:hypothetical protein